MITRRKFMAGTMATTALASSPFMDLGAAPNEQILRARPATVPIAGLDKPLTKVWSYEGTVPGRLLRAQAGDRVRFRLINQLEQPTSIHWHGIRIDNVMDGVTGLTQEAVPPKGEFLYDFTVPDAGTYWYHSHNRSWEQVARGLYGVLIVDEEIKPKVDREITMVLDDWRLDGASQIHEQSLGALGEWAHGGRVGNWTTVNGEPEPTFSVRAGERLRLRIVNAATARVIALMIPGHTVHVAGLDGHAIKPHRLKERIIIGPSQRVDLVLDADAEPGSFLPFFDMSDRNPIMLASFRYSSKPALRTSFPEVPALGATAQGRTLDLGAAQRVDLVMEGGAMGRMRGARIKGRMLGFQQLAAAGKVWAFNGVAGDMDKPLTRVPLGKTAVVRIVNQTAWPHAMHLHGHHFKAISRNRRSIGDPSWRDTVMVWPEDIVEIAFPADNPGKWLFHCHMLGHQAAGMVTWLEVG